MDSKSFLLLQIFFLINGNFFCVHLEIAIVSGIFQAILVIYLVQGIRVRCGLKR